MLHSNKNKYKIVQNHVNNNNMNNDNKEYIVNKNSRKNVILINRNGSNNNIHNNCNNNNKNVNDEDSDDEMKKISKGEIINRYMSNKLYTDKEYDTSSYRLSFVKSIFSNFFPSLLSDALMKQTGGSNITSLLSKKSYNLIEILNVMGCDIKYIGSGSTGHTFRCEIKLNDNTKPSIKFAIKIVAYVKNANYVSYHNKDRPENTEIMMLKKLSKIVLNNESPHIILPICTFYSPMRSFLTLYNKYLNESQQKHTKFMDNYKKKYYYDTVSVLICEWANSGDFLDLLKNNYSTLKILHWKVFFFHILITLALIQNKYPNFKHNDLKANNILIHEIKRKNIMFKYEISNHVFVVHNIGYIAKLWDFDFSIIEDEVPNLKVTQHTNLTKKLNISSKSNKYYDMHYFFNTLIMFVPRIFTDDTPVLREVKEFIHRVIPKKYRFDSDDIVIKKDKDGDIITKVCLNNNLSAKARLLKNDEYTTPLDVIINDDFFKIFRK